MNKYFRYTLNEIGSRGKLTLVAEIVSKIDYEKMTQLLKKNYCINVALLDL